MRADGQPMVNSPKGTEPQATDADVPVDLVLDEERINQYVEEARKTIAAENTEGREQDEDLAQAEVATQG